MYTFFKYNPLHYTKTFLKLRQHHIIATSLFLSLFSFPRFQMIKDFLLFTVLTRSRARVRDDGWRRELMHARAKGLNVQTGV